MNPSRRWSPRLLVATATGAAALLALAAPAWAHVDAEAVSVATDGAAVVTFEFSHGCDGAATTGLRIQIPQGVTDVVPQPSDGWSVDVSPTEFGWNGGSVPDHDKMTFTVDLRVSGEAGTVVSFPTIQQCGDLEEAWVEIAQPGEEEPEMVAPSITLATTIAPPSTTAPPSTSETPRSTVTTLPSGLATTTTLPAGSMPRETESNTGGLIVGIVTVAIIVGGAVLLFLRNRRPRPTPPVASDGSATDGSPDGEDKPPTSRSPH